MKRIFFLSMAIGIATIVACQTDFEGRTHLDVIAADSVYIEYRTAVFINTAHLTQGLYDLPAIGELIKASEYETMCDYPDLAVVDIRGGLLYRDTHCYMHKAAVKLNEKYPEYWKLSDNDKSYVKKKYDEILGAVQKQELRQIFLSRFDD